MNTNHVTRFYSLDFVRGLAALSIVFWHWQHLYFIGDNTEFIIKSQPGYSFFFPLYQGGWIAVEMFFSISGFVFFWLYAQSVRTKRMTGGVFAALRFSRLYPLYFVTLMIVCVGQFIYYHYEKKYYIYQLFDIPTFVRNLFFVQSWKFDTVESFNGPSWSVSVEILLYIVFFLVCRYFGKFLSLAVVCLMFGGLAISPIAAVEGRGLCSFFAGGLVYLIYLRLHDASAHRAAFMACLATAVGGWIMTILELKYGFVQAMLIDAATHLPPAVGGVMIHSVNKLLVLPLRLIVIPASILALVLHERRGATIYRRFAMIGDITYSSYLIHFPMQLVIAIFVVATASSPRFFQSGLGMLLFFIVLLALSFWSHGSLEMPMQRLIRTRLLRGARM